MSRGAILVLAVASALAGCGGSDDPAPRQAGGETAAGTAADRARRPSGEEGLRTPARQARIVAEGSDLGRVLFDGNGQVVYVFERDRPNRSSCTSPECVEAWPPVLTEEQPSAGPGLDAQLLGTIRREDGTLQVTYDGRPLYFYEHEGPGEIKCHDVSLHGGLWWVVTPSGEPAA